MPKPIEKHLSVLNGKWYQISCIPQFFTSNLVKVTTTITYKSNDDFVLINDAKKYTVDGPDSSISPKMWVDTIPGKCQAQFVWPLWADFWFIEADKIDDVEYMVISDPNAGILNIFAKVEKISDEVYAKILKILETKHEIGQDKLSQLQKTLH